MSQNQSYFWQTTRHNVYLKRSAKYHLLMALMAILTFSTICLAEMEPQMNDQNGVMQTEEVTKLMDPAENVFNVKEPNVAESPNEEKSDGINTKGTTSSIANLGFIHAFIASISVILVSELGDKTFFIAAIMAMRHSRLTVFTGAIGALGLMTVLSAVFGMAATIIPRVYTYYISTALFAIFGLKMLKEGYYMKDSEQTEFEEVESTLKKQDDKAIICERSPGPRVDVYLRRKMNDDYDDTDAKGKRKNSNPDSSSDAIGTRLASNSEMQHRQRKQSAPFNNNNVDDDTDAEDENSSQRRAMLPMSATATMSDLKEKIVTTKLPSFQSSPSLSTATAVTHVASNQNCDRKSPGDGNDEACSDTQSNGQSVVDPGVHSSTSRYSLDLKATNSISNNSLNKTSSIGQSNGKLTNGDVNGNGMELKQLTSKKREREVTSALVQDPETGIIRKNPKRSGAYVASRIFIQAFTMTFLAEWGDRSQLTTIILAAREDVYGVIIGGVLGHSICTGLAVIGGRMIAKKISVRTVTIIGGIVFLLFAVTSLFMSPDEEA